MPTSAEIRAWANANGHALPVRGNIPMTVRKEFDAANPGTPASPDYPDDDFEAAFAAPEGGDGESFDESAMGQEETRPRRPKAAASRAKGAAGPAGRFSWGRGKGKPKSGAAKKKPRISVEDLLGSLWRGAAKLAAPLPPLQRTLRVQAPVAGLLLEDAVRDTALDMFLQPLARLGNQGKVVSALAGPPVIVTAMTLHMMRCEAAGTDPNPVFLAVGTEALRSSLMTWMDVAGPKFEQAVKREAEFEDKYGKSVDDFIAMLFAPPVNPANEAAVRAEEEAIRRAQGIVVDA
jgi:hypothetical protein